MCERSADPGKPTVALFGLSDTGVLSYSLTRSPTAAKVVPCGRIQTAPLAKNVTVTARPYSTMCGLQVAAADCTVIAMKAQADRWGVSNPIAGLRIADGKVVEIIESYRD
ncbi:hypothetical protein [Nocardia heshunensis]